MLGHDLDDWCKAEEKLLHPVQINITEPNPTLRAPVTGNLYLNGRTSVFGALQAPQPSQELGPRTDSRNEMKTFRGCVQFTDN